MNVAYLFTFFLIVVVVLFLLRPFIQGSKSTFPTESANRCESILPEDIPLDMGRQDAYSSEVTSVQTTMAEHEVEIEVAVAKARHKSTFVNCGQCGHQMQQEDRFCASCGLARQLS